VIAVAPTYLVECYWPGVSEREVADRVAHVSGAQVTHVDSILVRDDEIVLCVFEGPSADAVRDATQRAGLPLERIVESVRVIPTRTQGVSHS